MKQLRSPRQMARCSLFAALIAIFGPLAIPAGPVPVTLAAFAVVLAAVVLEGRLAVAAVGVYLLLGGVGLPVFAGGQGGFGVFFGPTGGYLWSYLPLAAVTAFFAHKKAASPWGETALAAVGGFLGMGICYLCGTAQYMALTRTGPAAALLVCVAPFVPFDLVKILLAAALGGAVRRAAAKARSGN